MAKDLLKDIQIKAEKPRDKDFLLADGGGLFLRVRSLKSGGTKDWLFVFSFGGKRRRMGFGGLSDVSLKTAREKRDEARTLINRKIDPSLDQKKRESEQVAERQRLEERKARLTVQDLFEKWAHIELTGRKDAGKEVRRSFEKDVLPKLGKLAAEDVKRSQIAQVLDAVVERGARIVARNMLGDIRQMYGFGIKRGLLDNDPTSHMRRDDFGKKTERERVLTEAEIQQLVTALPKAKMGKTSELAIWLQLATCCRIGELSQAQWRDIDLDTGTWRIPADIAKNEKEHVIYLSGFAISKFKALQALTGKRIDEQGIEIDGLWAFPARYTKSHVCVKTLAKQINDRQRGEKGRMSCRTPNVDALILPGGKWTPHDLRRTGATMMVALGVLPEVVERCLNHIEQNRVKRIYQRHSYAAEMKNAWQLLGERLELLTSNTNNVVSMKRRKGGAA